MLRVIIALLLFVVIEPRSLVAGTVAGAELFTNGPLLHLKLQIIPSEMDSLRKDHRKSVHGTLSDGVNQYKDVAVHLKGAAGSYREVDDRPAFTLNFSRFAPKQKFHGLSKIHLNNSVQDPAMLDEAICGELFRGAGVPAARASHVLLEFNGKRLGIYVLKEGFAKEFLAQYFPRTDGNIYDPGFLAEVSEGAPRVLGKMPEEHAGIKELLAATNEKNEAKRWALLNQTLDVDRFISMSVMEVFTVHWDGYGFQKNNYKLYYNPENKKIVFFAHGMDQMFGRGGDPNLSVEPPMNGVVAQALYSTKEGRKRYLERLQPLHDQLFKSSDLTNRVDTLAAPVRVALKDNPDALRQYDGELSGLKERLVNRERQVASHLKKRAGG